MDNYADIGGSQLDWESNSDFIQSTTHKKHKFIKLDLADRTGMEKLFKEEKFDAVCHLAAQAGVRYSLENPHAYIDSNVVGFMNILEGCRHNDVKTYLTLQAHQYMD